MKKAMMRYACGAFMALGIVGVSFLWMALDSIAILALSIALCGAGCMLESAIEREWNE